MTEQEFHNRYLYNTATDCLGEGGFGKVYKAYDTVRDICVAIKVSEVKPQLEDVRLRKEVELIKALPAYPNIAYYDECYTFSTFTGEYDFGILQYYEQGNLEQLLRKNQLSIEQKESILVQILQGIEFLHNQGIIHRDLKPQNILIVNRKGEYIPKISDFGISKKLDVNKSSVFTNSLAGAGTLSFASPEQLCGQTIRKNTDLWSFGVIACWMFTGKLPFNSGNQTATSEAGRIELFKQITSGDASSLIQELPIIWQKLVKQCLVIDVERRIKNASQCLELLGEKILQNGGMAINKDANNTEIINYNPSKIDDKSTIYNHHDDKEIEIETINNNTNSTWRILSIIAICIVIFSIIGFYWYKSVSYDYIGSYYGGYAKVEKNNKWGFINTERKEIVPCQYDDVMDFKAGFADVKLNSRWGMVDNTGKECVPCNYENILKYDESHMVRIMQGDKWGYYIINHNRMINYRGYQVPYQDINEEIVPCIYDEIRNFCQGFGAVCKNKKWGFVNENGIEFVPCQFDKVDNFGFPLEGGLATRGEKNGDWWIIKSNGDLEVIKPPEAK